MELYKDYGRENGNYYQYSMIGNILGVYKDNVKENGNYYRPAGKLPVSPLMTPIMENEMEKKMENEMETGIT